MPLPNILGFAKELIKPVTELIDNLHTSEEEKGKVKAQIQELENNLTKQALQMEAELLNAQKEIIIAEAKGDSWIQRSWRPILMLTFTALIVLTWLGLTATLPESLNQELFDVVKIGIGGYILGRSGEKAVTAYSKHKAKNDSN